MLRHCRKLDAMPALEQSLIGSAEAGQILKKTPRTVQRMVVAGLLKPVTTLPGKTGAHLFNREDVEALAAADGEQAAS
jgi:hypothetical protein